MYELDARDRPVSPGLVQDLIKTATQEMHAQGITPHRAQVTPGRVFEFYDAENHLVGRIINVGSPVVQRTSPIKDMDIS